MIAVQGGKLREWRRCNDHAASVFSDISGQALQSLGDIQQLPNVLVLFVTFTQQFLLLQGLVR